MSVFRYEKDADGIVTIKMDMNGPVNTMNREYNIAMCETIDKLEQEAGLTGVVFTSAKKVFFAGGDLYELLAVDRDKGEEFFLGLEASKSQLRRIEKLPVPVVAAINSAALGGGFEIALCCNYRIVWNDASVIIGLPEVTLGLLPGGGGVVRMVNLLGLQKALPYLLEGTRVDAARALEEGLIHEMVDSCEKLVPAGKKWILSQRNNPGAAVQPWDKKGHRIPGGDANHPANVQMIQVAPALLFQKTRGLLPAPEKILDCAVSAARLDLDTALRIESQGLASLVVGNVAKNMMSTFFFGLNKVNAGASRPTDIPASKVSRVGVLGAGTMGQGIACSSAVADIEVVLKDITLEAAEKSKACIETLLARRVAKGRMDEAKKTAILDKIKPTVEAEDLKSCDLIIEAVFENRQLKHNITRELEGCLTDSGVWGSNTSTLPISLLAQASARPGNFIGVHFFSPVDKMPLVEIICGEKTSDATLARAFDYVRQIRKTPIVVSDSPGFFISRTFGTYLDEGIRLLVEGLHPVKIDALGKAVGMFAGPLAVHDEVSLELSHKVQQTWQDMGVQDKFSDGSIMRSVIATILTDNGRGGRHHDGGFYEYAEDGSKSIWPGLLDLYYKADVALPDADVKDRLLFRQVIETLKCLQSGVLRTVEDGNIGSIMGIGAPTWTGGFIQFVNTYGVQRFIDRCRELTAAYGERFEPPAIALEKAAAGALFS
ncbi:MAG: 3-hydroxyacyl-CoA dehydrogenase NAD-binding domain-containing protein [Parahaliea sp.]